MCGPSVLTLTRSRTITKWVARGGHRIEITRDALEHVRALPRKFQALVLQTLRTHLAREPATETRNRKLLSLPAPFGAHWELRFGPQNRLRAFYTIERATVVVVAVGVKDRERLRIGHEEVRRREGRVHRRGKGQAE
jgi:mRNA-degrading endonuclease RelE of RelBE toxin-antitoxin system